MNDKQLSIWKIIWIDYWAFISTIFCFFVPGFYIYDQLNPSAFIKDFQWYAVGIFLIALMGLVSRTVSIITLYNSGMEAKAIISEIGFFRGRGYIQYIFPFENRRYAGRMTVMKTKATSSYRVGDEVIVIVDRDNPKRSIIGDLFV